jgi:DeoR/GlpR family transcriptional regulator of sugar metabolism
MWPARKIGHAASSRRPTALEVARALPHDLGVSVITHSPTIAVALVDHPAEVFILGGRLFKHSVVASGAASPFPVLGLDEVTGIVSDAAPDHPVLAELGRAGVRVLSSE